MPCKNHPEIEEGLITCSICGETFCSNCIIELNNEPPFCGLCKVEHLKDLRSSVDRTTPALSSILRRIGAHFIDILI